MLGAGASYGIQSSAGYIRILDSVLCKPPRAPARNVRFLALRRLEKAEKKVVQEERRTGVGNMTQAGKEKDPRVIISLT